MWHKCSINVAAFFAAPQLACAPWLGRMAVRPGVVTQCGEVVRSMPF